MSSSTEIVRFGGGISPASRGVARLAARRRRSPAAMPASGAAASVSGLTPCGLVSNSSMRDFRCSLCRSRPWADRWQTPDRSSACRWRAISPNRSFWVTTTACMRTISSTARNSAIMARRVRCISKTRMMKTGSLGRRLQELILQVADHVAHGHVGRFHFVYRAVLDPFQHLAERLHQVEEGDGETRVVVLGDERLDLRIAPDVLLDHALLLQHFGGVLEALVLEQAVHEFLAGIFGGFAFHFQRRVARQQHARLDVDQGGRHVDEFGAQIDIHFTRFVHVLEVLRRDGGDRDVLDFNLLFADQVQQQIERPIVLLQMEIEWRRHYPSR